MVLIIIVVLLKLVVCQNYLQLFEKDVLYLFVQVITLYRALNSVFTKGAPLLMQYVYLCH